MRELRVLSEMLIISLIRKFNKIYHFTEEEVTKLKEYIVVSGDLSSNMSRLDEYMHGLSSLIKNPELDIKKIYELNHRLIMHNTALIDLITGEKLQPEDVEKKSYEDLEKLVCTEYKDSQPIPLVLP